MKMKLYHTAFLILKEPDIRHGRKNADFAQGFYTSPQKEFCLRWATEKAGCSTWINEYELDTEGLNIVTLQRDENWFYYLWDNRRLKEERYPDADVIIGPIANDTIYDTFGINTSGFLTVEQSLATLKKGPEYLQAAIKSEKAASKLKWISAKELSSEEIRQSRASVLKEQEAYQTEIARLFETF